VAYGLSVSDSLEGPWFQASGATYYRDWDKYELPRQVRHGSMLAITKDEYDALVKAFGDESANNLSSPRLKSQTAEY
jgi:hypothetical protein